MLRETVTILLLVFSSCSGLRGSLKQWQGLVQPQTKGQDWPELFFDQVLDHFDATNTK